MLAVALAATSAWVGSASRAPTLWLVENRFFLDGWTSPYAAPLSYGI